MVVMSPFQLSTILSNKASGVTADPQQNHEPQENHHQ
jgi:hypothetical protein